MRLDALIIFHIEWLHQVSSLVGKQSKYWSRKNQTENHAFLKNGWEPSQKMRLDALIIFHIERQPKVSSLVGKQSKYWSKKGKTENHDFSLRMAGNHLKRRALMRWSFSILNDNTKCLVWWVNNRNTEAGKTKTKVIQKASKGHQISTKTCQGLPKWCPGAKVQILDRFWLYFGSHFGSTFYQNSDKILQKRHPKINAGKSTRILW